MSANRDPGLGKLTAWRAVLLGHLVVNGPVVGIICLAGAVGLALGSAPFGALVGIVPGWVYWSLAVPRWRRWALARGAPPERTQQLAAATGLTWPKGFVLERTEARIESKPPPPR
jgi:hypothetical protein